MGMASKQKEHWTDVINLISQGEEHLQYSGVHNENNHPTLNYIYLHLHSLATRGPVTSNLYKTKN